MPRTPKPLKLPLIILAGQAGSGKDTTGHYLSYAHRGVNVGQADPLKRFAQDIFGFTTNQLWGPSEARNANDPRFDGRDYFKRSLLLDRLNLKFATAIVPWIHDVLPQATTLETDRAIVSLFRWFDEVVVRVSCGAGLSPRYVLQTLGTEWGRKQYENIWIDYAIARARELSIGGRSYRRDVGISFEPSVKAPGCVVFTDGRFQNEIAAVRNVGGIALRIIRPNSTLSAAAEKAGVAGHQSEREIGEMADTCFDGVIQNDGTHEDLYAMIDLAWSALCTPQSR